jgi:ribosome biogenesis GTPase / thiamine phosphate phosphatase
LSHILGKLEQGIITKATGSHFWVRNQSGDVLECIVRGKIRLDAIKSTSPVVVGDMVEFTREDKTDKGIITRILDRKNYLVRKSTNLSHEKHIIAANIDRVYLVVTLILPQTTTEFIDRFLISAEAYRIPATLVFNKVDLYDGPLLEQMMEWIRIYENAGYPCLQVSALNRSGTDLLKADMQGKVCLISGHSGVGKSTLINAIDPRLNLRIGNISIAHLKGKHTTAHSEMFELSNGAFLIDTPGIKGFGLIDMNRNEIWHFFPEIFKKSALCKYYNCNHLNEPGCAVKEAVETGEISISRYSSYLNILNDKGSKHRG